MKMLLYFLKDNPLEKIWQKCKETEKTPDLSIKH